MKEDKIVFMPLDLETGEEKHQQQLNFLCRQLPVQIQLLGCVHRSKPSKGTVSRGCLKYKRGIFGIVCIYRNFVFRQ